MADLQSITIPCDTIASCKPAMPQNMYELFQDHLASSVNSNQEGITPMRCYQDTPQVATSVVALAAPTPVEATMRDFLTGRVYQVSNKLDVDLRKQFSMDEQSRPKTAEELIKAIEDGNYTLDQELIDRVGEDIIHYNNEYGIRWGKEKPDYKGYQAARAVLREATQEVVDTVSTASIEEARQALKDFKVWQYQV